MKRTAKDACSKNNSKRVKTENHCSKVNDDEVEIGSNRQTGPSKSVKPSDKKASWNIPEVLADSYQVSLPVCKKLKQLLDDDCTLPFIARYRKEAVGNLEIESLRKMKTTMEELQKVQEKIVTVINTLEKQSLLTDELSKTICDAKNLEEIEFCYAPYKDTKKRTLAARAKDLGLEETAMKLLKTSENVRFDSLVKPKVEGLDSIVNIETGLQHIIAETIGKDKENIDKMGTLLENAAVKFQVSQSRSASKQNPSDVAKFESYVSKSFPVKDIKPHVFLAICRGEELKVLSIKTVFPDYIGVKWANHCEDRYLKRTVNDQERRKTITKSIKDAYDRIVEPLFERRIRTKLGEIAHRAAIDSFSRNLQSLLLSPPLLNTAVLGLDPGFKHGCKCAAVDSRGEVLHTETIHIDFGSRNTMNQPAVGSLRHMIKTYGCQTVALGNGKACRETENFLSNLIQNGVFQPHDVRYTIINESGASIYSCSPEAREEFPKLDPNLISARSIARRLQDPLTEYVRVSPQHIGVGMYQHDVSLKKLESALDDIVSECVSFVGVDVNVCPLHVLSKVAGLTVNKAKKIIDFRTKKGPFVNRKQILDVPFVGPKTFEQCAGFLAIREPPIKTSSESKSSAKGKGVRSKKAGVQEYNPLDRTCVHPESYQLAEGIVSMSGGKLNEIGHETFIRKLKSFLSAKSSKKIAKELDQTEEKIEQIIASLLQPLQYDFREKFDKPLFKRSVMSMNDLKIGQELTGRIDNIVDFGAFVDIGVGNGALLHVSGMKGKKNDLSLGMHISVRVTSVDIQRKRIGLELLF